jgi:antitoxin VapB
MLDIAKIFMTGRNQAVRLPAAYRFNTDQVFIRKNPETGDVILSARPDNWNRFFKALDEADFPDDFLNPNDRTQGHQNRDPLACIED